MSCYADVSDFSIITLIQQYPEFKDFYTDVYELCRNTEEVMGLFSKELQMLDENTVQYMIEDMQDKIDEQASTIDELQTSNQELLRKIHILEEKLSSK